MILLDYSNLCIHSYTSLRNSNVQIRLRSISNAHTISIPTNYELNCSCTARTICTTIFSKFGFERYFERLLR